MSFITDLFGGGDAPTIPEFKASTITGPTGTAVGTKGGGVSVTLSPELQQFYNQYIQAALGAAPTAAQKQFAGQVGQYGQGLFGQAANLNIPEMTQKYYQQQQDILAPTRAQEETRLANTLFSQGRTGAGVGVEGGYVNPEQYALLKAREEQNAQLALGAEDRARQIQASQLQQGLGLYGMGQELAYQPYQTMTNLLGSGLNLAQVNNPYIGYSMQGGQNVTGVNQANAQIQAQNQASNLGFWGGLLGAGIGALNPLGGLASKAGGLFGSAASTAGGWTPPSNFQTSSWWGGR